MHSITMDLANPITGEIRKVLIKTNLNAHCELDEFRIGQNDASIAYFVDGGEELLGYKKSEVQALIDCEDEDADCFECHNVRYFAKQPSEAVLTEYQINKEQFFQICDALIEILPKGNCSCMSDSFCC